MTKAHIVIFILMITTMIAAAIALGNWSEQLNPDGITPHPATNDQSPASASTPRDAFSFGVSMGLLGMSLLYCCVAFGMFIQSKTQRRTVGTFTYWVAGLALSGFVLSYLIDDYFY